ncbi:MAG: acylglycerol kinase family protein, partial [Bacteroidota bacterium]|nr:acylglycerol kinase family protein [Bacteroidota bacterium]
MKVGVIINESAGTATSENEKLIHEAFQKLNVKCEFFKFDPGKVQDLINEIEKKGCDIIIPAGGDGT